MRIIGLFGRSGAGKDTIAEGLIARGLDARIYKFAEPIKQMAADYLGVTYDDVDGRTPESREFVNNPHHLLLATFPNVRTPRQFMQWLGTDIFRDLVNEDVWSLHLLNRLDTKKDAFLTDCRFENTFDSIHKWRGLCVLVTREGTDTEVNHPSEAVPYTPDDYDIIIENDGPVEEVISRAADALGLAWLNESRSKEPTAV